MTKREKIEFVNELVASVQVDILNKISDDKVPEEWGGVQLRKLVAGKFSEVAYLPMNRDDNKKYRNDVLVNNL